ncbi:MAG: OB-fold domain-containing protein [Candidatus Bathyarchaeia archaeon]
MLGIIELEEGVKLLARIKEVKIEDIKIGMPLKIDFEKSENETWPNWPRYFFKPI